MTFAEALRQVLRDLDPWLDYLVVSYLVALLLLVGLFTYACTHDEPD